MKSILVEFARYRGLDRGILASDVDYLRTVASRAYELGYWRIDQYEFLKLLRRLRYEKADETDREDALETLCSLTMDFLCKQRLGLNLVDGKLLDELAQYDGDELKQIDIVANAAELSLVPFEAVFRENVVITRRVRRDEYTGHVKLWPTVPRVLFAWSSAGGDVPHEDHRRALIDALMPWLPADLDARETVFVELANVKLRELKEHCTKEPFTHIHILAHGSPLDEEEDRRFGLALDHPIEGVDVIDPEALVMSLSPCADKAVVVSLAACDGGNQRDTVNPGKSFAHERHVAGFEVVVASQLPLTKNGSTMLARRFFKEIFDGVDIRAALYAARRELHANQNATGHDWLSMVSYVRLPQGYKSHLEEVRLRSQLAALKNLSAKRFDGDLVSVQREFAERIEALEGFLHDTRHAQWQDECRGLLGSANKRLAEICGTQLSSAEAREASLEALREARRWYLEAWQASPAQHWSGAQYVVLHAALEGEVDPVAWRISSYAAEVARVRPEEYWAQGTLAELAMLGEAVGYATDDAPEVYLGEMTRRWSDQLRKLEREAKPAPLHSPVDATRAQLMRYVEWWQQDRGFFAGLPDVSATARSLVDRLAGAARG